MAKFSLKDRVLSIVDLETTGSSFKGEKIIEVGLIQMKNGEVIDEMQFFLDPGKKLAPIIRRITNIMDADLVGAPKFEEVADHLFEKLQDTVVVAHNVQFDYGFLKAEFERVGLSLNTERFCTARLSREIYPHYRKHNLDALIERFNFECINRHRAYDDADVLRQFMEMLREKMGDEVLEESISRMMKKTILPPRLKQRDLDGLPTSAGVYIFYGDSEYPLYIGKSKDVRKRVMSHFSSSNSSSKEFKIFSQTERIEVRETAGELGALLLESKLVKEMKPLHNRQLRRNLELGVIMEVERNGYKATELVKGEVDYGRLDKVLAVFKTAKAAKEYLLDTAKEYRLCSDFLLGKKMKSSCFYRELGYCLGVCQGEEDVEEYNERFDQAFSQRKIKQWPFEDYVLVSEDTDRDGEIYVFKDWCLVAEGKYSEDFLELREFEEVRFDKDVYKILRGHVRQRRGLKVLKEHEYQTLLQI